MCRLPPRHEGRQPRTGAHTNSPKHRLMKEHTSTDSTRKPIAILTEEAKAKSFAIAKARTDIDHIIRQSGAFRVIGMGSTSRVGFMRVLKRYYDVYSLRLRLGRHDRVFFQFPWIHNNKREFYRHLFGSGAEVSCVIHDLDSLRSSGKGRDEELQVLAKCRHIIAHTPAMKRFLVDAGIAADRIECLYLFSYLTDDPVHTLAPKDPARVIFAGNLTKSRFTDRLGEIAGSGVSFNLYGNKDHELRPAAGVSYKGKFAPDHPASIEGNWGLVWDGDSVDTCSGDYGTYLRYNSSHKISLYLSLGIPVILWEESSLRDYITRHRLGIAVKSLRDLPGAIGSLPSAQLADIRKHAADFAPRLRDGSTFGQLIRAAVMP